MYNQNAVGSLTNTQMSGEGRTPDTVGENEGGGLVSQFATT